MALIIHFKCTLKCRLQFVSIWTRLKVCRLVMSEAKLFRFFEVSSRIVRSDKRLLSGIIRTKCVYLPKWFFIDGYIHSLFTFGIEHTMTMFMQHYCITYCPIRHHHSYSM